MGDVQPFNSLTSGTNAMQLKKLSPLAGLLLTALLGACGGGGDDEPPPPAAPPPAAVSVSAVSLSSTSPPAYAENNLKFDGGECSGGTGALTVSWNFGDGTALDSSTTAPHTHKYDETAAGSKTVTVTCTDSTGKTSSLSAAFDVQTAAMNGFLGKKWTAYSNIETNISPYPVAGITTTGDVYGVWVRRNGITSAYNEVVTGTTSFSLSNWNVSSSSLATGVDRSPYIDSNKYMSPTAIDIAVSPNGYALTAWVAGTSVWYATKLPSGAWSTTTTPIGTSVVDDSIKVVVNEYGDGAIAYCQNDGTPSAPIIQAYVTPYLSGSTGTTIKISNKCSTPDMSVQSTLQRSRAFDISINNPPAINTAPTIYAAGIQKASLNPFTTTKSAVALQIYSGGWAPTPTILADEIATSPESLSLSLSPNGTYAALAWNQVDASAFSNVYISMLNGTVWSAAAAFSQDITPTTNYSRPLIAVNYKGDAILAMRLKGSLSSVSVAIANYDASAATPTWSKEKIVASSSSPTAGYIATDIAIDNWGTGLITNVDGSFNYTQAGTFAKKPGAAQWSGFKIISSANIDNVYYRGFHYQTMRALPDGRAIVVTSLYDDDISLGRTPIPSGYMLLK